MSQPQPSEISTRAQSVEDALADEVVVVVLSGSQRGRQIRLGQRMRVGKAPDNDLVLDDDTVSRHHCELERREHGVLVRDLGSTNHTRVGRTAIQEAVVEMGGASEWAQFSWNGWVWREQRPLSRRLVIWICWRRSTATAASRESASNWPSWI